MTGEIAAVSNVLETAINSTDARSRLASVQARAISRSTASSPVDESGVAEDGLRSVINPRKSRRQSKLVQILPDLGNSS
jgi:hypothetical protein